MEPAQFRLCRFFYWFNGSALSEINRVNKLG